MARVCRQVCGALLTTAACAGLAACAWPFAERVQPDADGGFVVFDPVSDDLERWEHYVLRNTIVVRRGVVRDGPVSESRDLLEDYRRAFGVPPETGVHAMAFFTDNDDTEEPVTAYYGPVKLQCTGAGES